MYINNFQKLNGLHFAFDNTNLFIVNDIEKYKNIIELHEYINSTKTIMETEIKFEYTDIQIYKDKFKLLKIPSIMDFQKEITNNNKTILNELLKNVISNSFWNWPELLEIKQNIDLIDFSKNNLLGSIIEEINTGLIEEGRFSINDNFGELIANLVNLDLPQNLSYKEIKKIYFIILKYLSKINDKHFFIIFENPYICMKESEIIKMTEIINSFTYKSIIVTNSIFIPKEYLLNTKIFIENRIFDLSQLESSDFDPKIYIGDNYIEKMHIFLNFLISNQYTFLDKNTIISKTTEFSDELALLIERM